MRKIYAAFSLSFLVVILTGCMEMLPFDIGGSSEEENVTEVETESEVVTDDADTTDESATDMVENIDAELEADNMTADQCPEGELHHLTDHLVPDFYIPACATLEAVQKNAGYVEGDLKVVNTNYEEVYNDYKAYFGENVSSDHIDIAGESAELNASLLDDEQHQTIIRIRTDNEGIVYVQVSQNLPAQ